MNTVSAAVTPPPDEPPPHRPPPTTPPISIDHGLQVHLQTCSITVSKCISKLALSRPPSASLSTIWSCPPSASPNKLDHGPQVHLHTHSIMSSKCISLLHDLQMHLQTRSITACKWIWEFNLISASKCISKLALSRSPSESLSYTIWATKLARSWPACAYLSSSWSRPPSVCLSYSITPSKCNSQPARSRPPSESLSSTRSRPSSGSRISLDRGLQVHLPGHMITASKCISRFSQSLSRGVPAITLQ